MQHTYSLRRGYRAAHAKPWRERNVALERKRRPMPSLPVTTYRVRVRNTSGPDRSAWATLVKRARVVMSGAEMARRLKVDRATIWRWETGQQRPERVETVQAFASLFRVDLNAALDAAGLRPATDEVAPTPEMRYDPDVMELQRMLDDPSTPEATKDQIRAMVRSLRELAAIQRERRRPAV